MTRSLLTNVFVKESLTSSSSFAMNSKGSNFLLASTSAITQDKLDKWRQNFYDEPKNLLAQNVCSRFDPFEVCLSRKCLETTNHVFTHKVSLFLLWISFLHNLMRFFVVVTGGIGRQACHQSKKFRQMLAICRPQLPAFAHDERIQSGWIWILSGLSLLLG